MSEPDADHYRYRALLRDANDESKRLALIQLLIDERAREKLAAQLKTAKAEVLPEHQPFVPPVPRYWGVPQKVVGPAERRWSGEINTAAAGAVSIGVTHPALPPAPSEPEPPALPQEPAEPKSYAELADPPPQNLAATLDTAISGPVALVLHEPSRPDHPAGGVARPISSGAAFAPAGPAMAESPGAPPAANDIEIASRIQAALTELTRVQRPQHDVENLDRLSAPSEAANPEAQRSVTVVGVSTNDRVARFIRLMSKGLTLPTVTMPSASIAPPPEGDEENSIALQIQAALAKQKRDGQ